MIPIQESRDITMLHPKRYSFSIIEIIPYFFVVLFFILMLLLGPHRICQIGESDDYILLSVALQNHWSDSIDDTDIEQAKRDFSGMNWEFYPNGSVHLPISIEKSGGTTYYSWYFISYSLFCIPFKYITQLIGIHPIYAFYAANLCILLLSVYFAEKWLRTDITCPRLLPYLLLWTPSLVYIFWPSAEVFLMACATLAAAALFSGRYLTAAFWSGVASSMNITFMLFYPFLYLKYFFRKDMFISFDKEAIKKAVIHNWENIHSVVFFTLLTFIGFIPVLINLLRWKRITVMQGMGSSEGFIDRFIAYIIDLNFGILPYFPLLMLLFMALLLFTEKKEFYIYTLSIIGIILSFSLMVHINSGMGFLSRYVSWTMPLIIIGIQYYLNVMDSTFVRKSASTILIISCIYTSSLSFYYFIKYKGNAMNYTDMLAVPAKFMEHFPELYNPLPSTFNSRINHVDGGYDVEKNLPVLYRDGKGNIRKALLNRESAGAFFERLRYPSSMQEEIRAKREQAQSAGDTLFYLSFGRGVTLEE